MYELYPYFTNDGSVGLYSPEANDIYHSTYGALSEAYEKFVLPAELEKYFKNKNEIKVLDICFGIGYNTKSFLNFLLEKKILKFENKNTENLTNNCAIYTNNSLLARSSAEIYSDNNFCNETGYTDNNQTFKNNMQNIKKNPLNEINTNAIHSNNNFHTNSACTHTNPKIFIKALDIDENLFQLSPFFKQGTESDKKHNKLNFHYEKISKLLDNQYERKYKLKNEVNFLLFKNIIEKMPQIFENEEIHQILNDKKYSPFFDQKLRAYFKFIKNERGKYTPLRHLSTFLHNIYYRHISTSYKKALNSLILHDFIFEPIIGDARKSLLQDKNIYNFVFLDAFTPAKCPSLWSLDFFKLLFEHLSDDGMILTYSNSSAVRNAILNAGFHVGKIFNEEIKKYTGTIAVKNKSLIKHELSEYDLGLINSKAGVFYRDENLNGLNEAIIEAREKETLECNKISSSKFIKEFRRKNEV